MNMFNINSSINETTDTMKQVNVYVFKPPTVESPPIFDVIQNAESLTCAVANVPEKVASAKTTGAIFILVSTGANNPAVVIMATVPEP